MGAIAQPSSPLSKNFELISNTLELKPKAGSVIYQLSDIRMDDQIPDGEVRSVIYQTRYFAPNILRDDYVNHFLAFRLQRFDCSNIP